MDVASSAVGIASIGIQVCQALLAYYEDWRSYHSDINSTYDSIDDLSRTLVLLRGSLNDAALDDERKSRVKTSLRLCENSLTKLSAIRQKLREYGQPLGIRQKVWAELQRAWFPFKAGTLAKLQTNVSDTREHLKLAVQVLQLDIATTTQHKIDSVAVDTSTIIGQNVALATSVKQVSVQAQQILALQRSSLYRKILNWLNAPDPAVNYVAAHQKREALTGTWLLQSSQYRRWKAGDFPHLWLCGKAGCGKTVLCSTVIEDLQAYCPIGGSAMLVVFFFTFSDDRKQSYENLLRSLVAEVGWQEPGLALLTRAYERPHASSLTIDELEKIVLACIQTYDEVFVCLDALDECPEHSDLRQNVLEGLERLTYMAPNIRLFVTSREVIEIGESMEAMSVEPMSIAVRSVDADIRKYIATELSHDRKLSKLDAELRDLIEATITQRADGMFRYAYCQLQELKRLKSSRPSHVKATLANLPDTLDTTYERMLTGIEEGSRTDALTLLQWLAYARSPLTLGQLAEARIIDLEGDGAVLEDDRGGLEDSLRILAGLVTIDTISDGMYGRGGMPLRGKSHDPADSEGLDDLEDLEDRTSQASLQSIRGLNVRLSHFTVKEYLESRRILLGSAIYFHLDYVKGQDLLTQRCLIYLEYYRSTVKNKFPWGDHNKFTYLGYASKKYPLLDYAAEMWYHHSRDRQDVNAAQEIALLQSDDALRSWLGGHPHLKGAGTSWLTGGGPPATDIGPALYYASALGLVNVVSTLLSQGADVNAPGGRLHNALHAASEMGHKDVVRILMDHGAEFTDNPSFPGPSYRSPKTLESDRFANALQAAARGGHTEIVRTLSQRGANVNGECGQYHTALQAAASRGHEDVVNLLIAQGADVNSNGGRHGTALQAASFYKFERIVKTLVEEGADVNAQGGEHFNALCAASSNEKVVEILLDAGADVNALNGCYSVALYAAALRGSESVTKILLDHGAAVNYRSVDNKSALTAASEHGHEAVVELLIKRGADVRREGGEWPNALYAAAVGGHTRTASILLKHGTKFEFKFFYSCGGLVQFRLLKAALWAGRTEVVEMLLEGGALVDGPRETSRDESPSETASEAGTTRHTERQETRRMSV